MSGCIIKSDEVFNELSKISTETKRWLVGKYFTGEKFKTDLSKAIPVYTGNSICHRKFNFTTEGTKCFWCNTFSLLTQDGEIIPQQPINIETGSFRGQKILIEKTDKSTLPFGTYDKHIITLNSHILNVEKMINMERMINKSCDASHSVAISSLINSSPVPFKSRILGGWICDNVNTVKLIPNPGNISIITFNDAMVKDIFFQLFILSGTDYFNHGSPSAKHLFVSAIPSQYELSKDKKINMGYTLFIDPDIYSSFYTEYNGRKLHFVGRHSVETVPEPNWNVRYIVGYPSRQSQITKSPCIKKYAENRVATFKPNMDMINYIRFTGINVFPSLNFFLYLTIFMINKTFHDIFINGPLMTILDKVFMEDDKNKYFKTIQKYFGREFTADQIVEVLIESDINIRYDLFNLISKNIAGNY